MLGCRLDWCRLVRKRHIPASIQQRQALLTLTGQMPGLARALNPPAPQFPAASRWSIQLNASFTS